MKFGVREICNVTFKAQSDVVIGNKTFKKGQPVLYIDSAKTSTVEGAATTVYATGGRGNTRLIAWEGEKTLTFTVEDALLSPLGFSILSGAGLFGQNSNVEKVHVHMTTLTTISSNTTYNKVDSDTGVYDANKTYYSDDQGTVIVVTDAEDFATKVVNPGLYVKVETYFIDLNGALASGESVDSTAPIFVAVAEEDGSLTGDIIKPSGSSFSITDNKIGGLESGVNTKAGQVVFVDYYITKDQAKVDELQIDAGHFAGFYYVEADTLFRRKRDGVDLAAVLTFPKVKIQSNFTFTMASTGDPSTFTFTMDAFPGYTYFDKTKEVLCVMQIINPDTTEETLNVGTSVMPHGDI